MRIRKSPILSALLLLLCPVITLSQNQILNVYTTNFPTAEIIGDVNQDGYEDFVVGNPLGNFNNVSTGVVSLYSGFDKTIIYSVGGAQSQDLFGASIAITQDRNGDGIKDLLVGAPVYFGSGLGYVRLISGASGAVLSSYTSGRPTSLFNSDGFGGQITELGDINQDGISDIGVLEAYVLSGSGVLSTGVTIVYSSGQQVALSIPAGWNVRSIRSIDDYNGDGVRDLVVSSEVSNSIGNFTPSGNSGAVLTIYSGASLSIVTNIVNYFPVSLLAPFSAVSVGDINGDSVSELAIADPNGSYIYLTTSGQVGSYLWSIGPVPGHQPGDRIEIKKTRDFDLDGRDDLLVTTFDNNTFASTIFGVSAVTGVTVFAPITIAGYSVTGLNMGDVNGDGSQDFIVANSGQLTSLPEPKAVVYSTTPLYPASSVSLSGLICGPYNLSLAMSPPGIGSNVEFLFSGPPGLSVYLIMPGPGNQFTAFGLCGAPIDPVYSANVILGPFPLDGTGNFKLKLPVPLSYQSIGAGAIFYAAALYQGNYSFSNLIVSYLGYL